MYHVHVSGTNAFLLKAVLSEPTHKPASQALSCTNVSQGNPTIKFPGPMPFPSPCHVCACPYNFNAMLFWLYRKGTRQRQ